MSMVRYLILRTLIFVGCLAATWLLGLRDQEEQLLAVVLAAVASLLISAVVLKPFRQQASADIAERVDRRLDRKRAQDGDEVAEDAEVERPGSHRNTDGISDPSPGSDADSDFR